MIMMMMMMMMMMIIIIIIIAPQSIVLFEKLISSQLVKKFPVVCGSPSPFFPTTSLINTVHILPSSFRSTLILSPHICPGLLNGPFLEVSPPKFCVHFNNNNNT
jgi:hypothetical protein